jgi:hypothetical protein
VLVQGVVFFFTLTSCTRQNTYTIGGFREVLSMLDLTDRNLDGLMADVSQTGSNQLFFPSANIFQGEKQLSETIYYLTFQRRS